MKAYNNVLAYSPDVGSSTISTDGSNGMRSSPLSIPL